MPRNLREVRGVVGVDHESQRGKWQVYVKAQGAWVTIGGPLSRASALEVLKGIKERGGLEQSHVVPL